MPPLNQLANLFEHIQIKFYNKSIGFKQINKLIRINHTLFRVNPSNQCFRTGNRLTFQFVFRLKIRYEVTLFKCLVHLHLQCFITSKFLAFFHIVDSHRNKMWWWNLLTRQIGMFKHSTNIIFIVFYNVNTKIKNNSVTISIIIRKFRQLLAYPIQSLVKLRKWMKPHQNPKVICHNSTGHFIPAELIINNLVNSAQNPVSDIIAISFINQLKTVDVRVHDNIIISSILLIQQLVFNNKHDNNEKRHTAEYQYFVHRRWHPVQRKIRKNKERNRSDYIPD